MIPKPKEGDILVLRQSLYDEDWWSKGVVIQAHDSLDESWDPYGEHAWSQADQDEFSHQKGEWYAIIENPDCPGETMSVGSYEVTAIESHS